MTILDPVQQALDTAKAAYAAEVDALHAAATVRDATIADLRAQIAKLTPPPSKVLAD